MIPPMMKRNQIYTKGGDSAGTEANLGSCARKEMTKIIKIREERCTGCRVCELVCSLEKTEAFNPQKSRIKIFEDRRKGVEIASVCQLCDPAPCIDACPAGALGKDPKMGTLLINHEICQGERCLSCQSECPHGAITWDVEDESLICCDLCGGDPECVKVCRFRALTFEKCDPEEMEEQRNSLEALLEPFLKIQKANRGALR